jgi:hypothetical protein
MFKENTPAISRRGLLRTVGLSAGASLFNGTPIRASEDGIVPTMVAAAAKAKITIRPIRRNISLLEGSGGNMTVLLYCLEDEHRASNCVP